MRSMQVPNKCMYILQLPTKQPKYPGHGTCMRSYKAWTCKVHRLMPTLRPRLLTAIVSKGMFSLTASRSKTPPCTLTSTSRGGGQYLCTSCTFTNVHTYVFLAQCICKSSGQLKSARFVSDCPIFFP